MSKYFLFLIVLFLISLQCISQDEDKFVHTKEGSQLGAKRMLVLSCKESYGAPAENQLVWR